MYRPIFFLTFACAAGAQQSPERWQLREEVRFGDDRRAEAVLSGGGDLIVGPAGEVYISQPTDAAVRVFARTGDYLRTIGRKGEGPGEFLRLGGLGFLGDTLWVVDPQLQRVSFFGRGGRVIQSSRMVLPGRDPYLTSLPFTLLKDGSALTVALVPTQLVTQGFATRVPIIRHDRRGKVLDTLHWIDVRHATGGIRPKRGGFLTFRQPFGDDPLLTPVPSGGGVVVVERQAASSGAEASFAVHRYGSTGRLEFQARVPYRPTPLTDREAEGSLETAFAFFNARRNREAPPVELTELLPVLYRPAYMPPVTGAVVAVDGSVWLRGPEIASSKMVTYSVLSANGKTLATVDVPRSIKVRYVEGGSVYALGTDNDDAPFAGRYRVVRSGPAPVRGRGR